MIHIYIGKSKHLSFSYSAYTYFAILRTLMCQQTAIDRTTGGFFLLNIDGTKWNREVKIRWKVLMTM